MIFRLCIYNKKLKEYKAKSDYKTRQMAETKSKPYIEKGRKVKIVPIPTDELKIGLKVYLSNGELYGEIVDEDDSFWYIKRIFKDEDDRAFFLKDEFLDKYENGTFIMEEESDDKGD